MRWDADCCIACGVDIWQAACHMSSPLGRGEGVGSRGHVRLHDGMVEPVAPACVRVLLSLSAGFCAGIAQSSALRIDVRCLRFSIVVAHAQVGRYFRKRAVLARNLHACVALRAGFVKRRARLSRALGEPEVLWLRRACLRTCLAHVRPMVGPLELTHPTPLQEHVRLGCPHASLEHLVRHERRLFLQKACLESRLWIHIARQHRAY